MGQNWGIASDMLIKKHEIYVKTDTPGLKMFKIYAKYGGFGEGGVVV